MKKEIKSMILIVAITASVIISIGIFFADIAQAQFPWTYDPADPNCDEAAGDNISCVLAWNESRNGGYWQYEIVAFFATQAELDAWSVANNASGGSSVPGCSASYSNKFISGTPNVETAINLSQECLPDNEPIDTDGDGIPDDMDPDPYEVMDDLTTWWTCFTLKCPDGTICAKRICFSDGTSITLGDYANCSACGADDYDLTVGQDHEGTKEQWEEFSNNPDKDEDGLPDPLDDDVDGDGTQNQYDSDADGNGTEDELEPDSPYNNWHPPDEEDVGVVSGDDPDADVDLPTGEDNDGNSSETDYLADIVTNTKQNLENQEVMAAFLADIKNNSAAAALKLDDIFNQLKAGIKTSPDGDGNGTGGGGGGGTTPGTGDDENDDGEQVVEKLEEIRQEENQQVTDGLNIIEGWASEEVDSELFLQQGETQTYDQEAIDGINQMPEDKNTIGKLLDNMLANNPVAAVITGSQVTASGQCSMSVPLYSSYVELSICDYASTLQTWGAIIVALAGLKGIFIIFNRR